MDVTKEVPPAGAVPWVCRTQLPPSAGYCKGWAGRGATERSLPAPQLFFPPAVSGNSGSLCPPSFSPNWFKPNELKTVKGFWQTDTNANRQCNNRSLISLGHQAKEKPHRQDDNSTRKKKFSYLQDDCISLFCYVKFAMLFDHLASPKTKKEF